MDETYPGKPEAGTIQWQETQEVTPSEEQLELSFNSSLSTPKPTGPRVCIGCCYACVWCQE